MNDGCFSFPCSANSSAEAADDQFFNQPIFETIQPQFVLTNAVNSLDLNEGWGGKQLGGATLTADEKKKLIMSRVKLATIRTAGVTAIKFYGEDPNEAALVANAIAEAYCHFHVEGERQIASQDLTARQDYFVQGEKQIQNLQTNLTALHHQLKIQDESQTDARPDQWFYWDKKRELDQKLLAHKILKDSIGMLKADLERTATSIIQITDKAEPPWWPLSPNHSVAVLMIGVGVFVMIAGLLCLKPSAQGDTSP